jgi:DNA polymerase-3 subunit alpha
MSVRFEVHSHTHYSNLRLLDCINRPKDLIDRAIKLGLSGIAITDHEALSRTSRDKFLCSRIIK